LGSGALQVVTVIAIGAFVVLGDLVWRRYRIPTVSVSRDGVVVKQWSLSLFALRWADVRRLDAGVEGVSYYCVKLVADEVYEVWHTYHGFGEFIAAILKRWPEAEPGWDSLTDAEGGTWLTLWERG
jgi:hypothetical protein